MSWNDCTLGDVAVFNYGKALPERVRVPGEFPVYGSGGCVGTHVSAIISGPGIVVGRKGTVGATYWVDGDFCPIDTTYYVTPKSSETNIRFLYYLIESLPLSEMNTDAAVPGLNRDNALRVKIRFPDPNIQSQVAELLAGYDDFIENNRRRIVLLEEAARLLYREWFVHFRFPGHEHVKIIDGVPEGWKLTTLGGVAVSNLESHKKDKLPEVLNYIDISSVSRGKIDFKTKMSALAAPSRARRIARHGDTIWSNVRPNLRAYSIVQNPAKNDVFSTGFTVLHAEKIGPYYLYFFVTSNGFVDHLINHATGTSYPAVRSEDFKKAEIVVPPAELRDSFEEFCEPLFCQMEVLKSELQECTKAKDILLPRLMDGRLEV